MTKGEALKKMQAVKAYMTSGNPIWDVTEIGEAFGMAIEALKQPEPKTGKWIIKTINTFSLAYGSTAYEPVYECSACGGVEESYLRLDEPIMPEDAGFPKYCPNCGAKMEGGQDDT